MKAVLCCPLFFGGMKSGQYSSAGGNSEDFRRLPEKDRVTRGKPGKHEGRTALCEKQQKQSRKKTTKNKEPGAVSPELQLVPSINFCVLRIYSIEFDKKGKEK